MSTDDSTMRDDMKSFGSFPGGTPCGGNAPAEFTVCVGY